MCVAPLRWYVVVAKIACSYAARYAQSRCGGGARPRARFTVRSVDV